MPKQRPYGMNVSPVIIEAYEEFLNILNEEKKEKDEIEANHSKEEIFQELRKRGHIVSKSAINSFAILAIKAQNSRPIFDVGKFIVVR